MAYRNWSSDWNRNSKMNHAVGTRQTTWKRRTWTLSATRQGNWYRQKQKQGENTLPRIRVQTANHLYFCATCWSKLAYTNVSGLNIDRQNWNSNGTERKRWTTSTCSLLHKHLLIAKNSNDKKKNASQIWAKFGMRCHCAKPLRT